MRSAVLLLSGGGLDSYTAGAIAAAEGFRLHVPVRVQLQLHNFIWDPSTRGV